MQLLTFYEIISGSGVDRRNFISGSGVDRRNVSYLSAEYQVPLVTFYEFISGSGVDRQNFISGSGVDRRNVSNYLRAKVTIKILQDYFYCIRNHVLEA